MNVFASARQGHPGSHIASVTAEAHPSRVYQGSRVFADVLGCRFTQDGTTVSLL